MARRLPPSTARTGILALVCLGLLGCNTMGPAAVTGARSAYSDALAVTQQEQLLKNLVRMRYLDMPHFLQVTSVNTQYELRGSLNASITGVFDNHFSDSTGNLGGGLSVVERPTVTYAPLEGDEFVKRVMSPIGLESLALMVRSGWRVEQVLLVCAQALGPAANAPRAAGPSNDADTDNTDFMRLARLMGDASRSGGGRLIGGGEEGYRMVVDTKNPDVVAWLEAMGVPLASEVPVAHGYSLDREVISIQTRSLLGAMFYLSLGIRLPEEHVKSGIAPIPPNVDYQDVTEGFFVVHSARSRPSRATIVTRHRGYWYYIDDTDHRSKATFGLLALLFSLQSGSRQALQPAVTIPLN